MEFTPRMTQNMRTAQAAAVGSMVLLKNIHDTLPLRPQGSEKLPVAVFGMGQVRTVFACPEFVPYHSVNVLDGLCASELVKPDGLLAHKYRAWALSHPTGDLPWRSLSMEELAENNAAAVVVLSRDEDAYDPIINNDELAMLEAVTKVFPRTVLVLNTPGYMEAAAAASLCGAVVYMGIPGQEGGAALAELLTGQSVFLGHLNQSWPRRRAEFIQANQVQDIYCGYRYFDSFGSELLYDFGYGLTYGTAEIAAIGVAVDRTELVVTAEVVNTGEVWPVSQVVQVYVSRPAGKLPQPKYVLAGFARTAMLDPGQSQQVEIRLELSELASYSEASAAFLLEAGYYDVRVGFSARSAMVAGSLLLKSDALLAPVLPLPMAHTVNRPTGLPYTYPGEAEEIAQARKRAIRLSGWNLKKTPLKRPPQPALCRGTDHPVRLEDVKAGTASVYELAAAMDDVALRHLVLDFGLCPGGPEGALGASADLKEDWGIPSMSLAAGADGLLLTREIVDPETGEITARQNCTAFPAAGAAGVQLGSVSDLRRGRGRGPGDAGIRRGPVAGPRGRRAARTQPAPQQPLLVRGPHDGGPLYGCSGRGHPALRRRGAPARVHGVSDQRHPPGLPGDLQPELRPGSSHGGGAADPHRAHQRSGLRRGYAPLRPVPPAVEIQGLLPGRRRALHPRAHPPGAGAVRPAHSPLRRHQNLTAIPTWSETAPRLPCERQPRCVILKSQCFLDEIYLKSHVLCNTRSSVSHRIGRQIILKSQEEGNICCIGKLNR